jgi:putative heme-binding domain-containing protein
VRARHAWAAWYHIWGYRFFAQLVELADDDDPRVASNAINQIANYFSIAPDIDLKREKGVASAVAFEAVVRWLGHDDRRVRLAASRIVERITPARWQTLEKELGNDGTSRAIVSFICGSSSRTGSNAIATGSLLSLATASVQRAKTIDEKRDAIRAIMLALGDWNIDKPAVEVFAAYSLKTSPDKRPGFHRLLMRPVVEGLRADFPSTDERFNIEASRLFAMLEVDDPAIIRKVASQITETSHPTRDFHYLAVLARLGPLRDDTHSAAIADSLLCLPKKLVDQKVSIESNWSPRFAELIGELVRVQPKLDEVLAAHPDLAQPGNVVVASKLKGVPRREAAKRLLVAVRENADYPLTSELVDMLAELPAANVLPVFRARWSDRSMREALVKHLAAKPIEDDRSKFLESLESGNRDTVNACLQALETIPRDDSAKNLIPVFARLRQSFSEPKEAALRKRLLALIERQSAHQFVVIESAIDAAALATAYRTIFAWFEKTHPNEAKLLTTNAEDEEALRKMLSSVKWDAGDFDRGRKLFVGRGCQTCHGGNARLGPDLAGVGKRLNRDDLLTSIVNPSRDVSPAYRLTNIDTKDGKRTSGVIVYDSNEMLLVQTGPAETKRILAADVESRLPSAKSLMPDGLLKGIKPEELADLFAYLAKQ